MLDVNDPGINDFFEPENIRVPFRNMIYIGDSDTDIPCMKLVNSYSGHSIGVYNPDTKNKAKVYKMMHDNRIKYFAPADYSENSEIDVLVKAIIDRTAYNEKLETIHYKNKKEFMQNDEVINSEEREKRNLIISLENSGSFANTHSVIEKLREYNDFSDFYKNWLVDIALENSQVNYIITDADLKHFYGDILNSMASLSEKAEMLKEMIES